MATPLEKARKDPDSMKARILMAARRVFGEYGFHGTTTRMIAQEVGIDVSTIYYHWGEKGDLYEAVVLDINKDLQRRLAKVEGIIHGLPLAKRMGIALDELADYLFKHPEITNVIISRYFVKIRHEVSQDIDFPEYISNIAISMHLAKSKKNVSAKHKLQMLAIMNAVYTFVSGAESFQESLGIEKDKYISLVKDTLKFILIPAFVNPMAESGSKGDQKSKNQ